MMKISSVKTYAVRVLLAVFLIALFAFSSLSPGIAGDRVTLTVSLQPYISYAPIFIAMEEGYFEEQGLEIELFKVRGSEQAVPALARGDLDVGTHSIGSNLFAAVSRGIQLKIVADKGHLEKRCNYVAIMVRKDLYDKGELVSVKQLRGRKIAVSAIPTLGYIYETILSTGGLTLDDVEIVRIPVSSKIEALETGAIDAASAVEPQITQWSDLGYAVPLFKYEDFFSEYQVTSIIFGPRLTEQNPELGKKFMVAYLKGVRQYNRGKTERNMEIFQKYTGLDVDILKKICLPSISPDGHVHTESILAVQDWAYEKGFIDSKVSLDRLVDMSFVEHANRILEQTEDN